MVAMERQIGTQAAGLKNDAICRRLLPRERASLESSAALPRQPRTFRFPPTSLERSIALSSAPAIARARSIVRTSSAGVCGMAAHTPCTALVSLSIELPYNTAGTGQAVFYAGKWLGREG